MNDDEAASLGPLVRDVSRALHVVIGCEKTYVAQFAEHVDHRHVHFHVIPRSANLAEALRGAGIFRLLGVPVAEAVSDTRMDAIAAEVRDLLH